MKKIIAIALAAVMALSLAACAKQNGKNGTTTPSGAAKGQAKSALEILEKVWSKYSATRKTERRCSRPCEEYRSPSCESVLLWLGRAEISYFYACVGHAVVHCRAPR